MSTKNSPGKFDCYAAAQPNEPMFILLGRDPFAAQLVQLWAEAREQSGEDPEKVAEARESAQRMYDWCVSQGKQPMKLSGFMAQAAYRSSVLSQAKFDALSNEVYAPLDEAFKALGEGNAAE